MGGSTKKYINIQIKYIEGRKGFRRKWARIRKRIKIYTKMEVCVLSCTKDSWGILELTLQLGILARSSRAVELLGVHLHGRRTGWCRSTGSWDTTAD